MQASQQITITLPLEVINHMHKRIAAGDFASPSEYFEHLSVESLLPPAPAEQELVHWMNTEGARRLEALHNNPESGLTLDEAFEGLLDDETESS